MQVPLQLLGGLRERRVGRPFREGPVRRLEQLRGLLGEDRGDFRIVFRFRRIDVRLFVLFRLVEPLGAGFLEFRGVQVSPMLYCV